MRRQLKLQPITLFLAIIIPSMHLQKWAPCQWPIQAHGVIHRQIIHCVKRCVLCSSLCFATAHKLHALQQTSTDSHQCFLKDTCTLRFHLNITQCTRTHAVRRASMDLSEEETRKTKSAGQHGTKGLLPYSAVRVCVFVCGCVRMQMCCLCPLSKACCLCRVVLRFAAHLASCSDTRSSMKSRAKT